MRCGGDPANTSALAPPSEHSTSLRLTSAPPRLWGNHRSPGPSPGYTVASLPPSKRKQNSKAAEEITPDFIEDVFNYLGMQFENVAAKFDAELAAYTGFSHYAVKKDRRAALTAYCKRWVEENPELGGEVLKGGFW